MTLPSSGTQLELHLEAHQTDSQDNDYFPFEFSTNGGQSWLTLFQAYLGATDSNSDLTYALPPLPAGPLLLRVRDTNHSGGSTFRDTVTIDEIFVRLTP